MKFKSLAVSFSIAALLAGCAGKPAIRDIDVVPPDSNPTPNTPTLVSNPPPVDVVTTLDPPLKDANAELGQLQLTVHFDLNMDTIKPEDAQALQALAKKLDGKTELFKKYQLTIQGHTDVRGTDAINDALSGRRANAVLSFLRRNSTFLASQKLEAIGQGSHYLLKQGSTEADHAANRRAEIRMVNKVEH